MLAIPMGMYYTKRATPAGVMELVDVADSKSAAGDSVPVRVRSPAPHRSKVRFAPTFFFTKEHHPPAPLLLLSKSQTLTLVCDFGKRGIWNGCIFSVNTRHVGASFVSLAPTYFISRSALTPLRLLFKPQTLRWFAV